MTLARTSAPSSSNDAPRRSTRSRADPPSLAAQELPDLPGAALEAQGGAQEGRRLPRGRLRSRVVDQRGAERGERVQRFSDESLRELGRVGKDLAQLPTLEEAARGKRRRVPHEGIPDPGERLEPVERSLHRGPVVGQLAAELFAASRRVRRHREAKRFAQDLEPSRRAGRLSRQLLREPEVVEHRSRAGELPQGRDGGNRSGQQPAFAFLRGQRAVRGEQDPQATAGKDRGGGGPAGIRSDHGHVVEPARETRLVRAGSHPLGEPGESSSGGEAMVRAGSPTIARTDTLRPVAVARPEATRSMARG